MMVTPRYQIVFRRSIICSTHLRSEKNSEPYVDVSTVLCFLDYQSTGVLLTKESIPVTELPVSWSYNTLEST